MKKAFLLMYARSFLDVKTLLQKTSVNKIWNETKYPYDLQPSKIARPDRDFVETTTILLPNDDDDDDDPPEDDDSRMALNHFDCLVVVVVVLLLVSAFAIRATIYPNTM
jgi:hypothetical protein